MAYLPYICTVSTWDNRRHGSNRQGCKKIFKCLVDCDAISL